MKSKFKQTFDKIINEFSIITEDYNIFPVPKLLINDMVDFCLTNSNKEKQYHYENILNKYAIDWKYYPQFKENLELMINKNKYGSITLCPYNTDNALFNFLKKYHKNFTNITDNSNIACIFDYDRNFNLCLLVNVKNSSKFLIFKSIQHELIHWMQYVLNTETKKNYGQFNDMKFSISNDDKEWLLSATFADENMIKYLEQGFEFEPWVANCVENFEHSNYSLDEFQTIIKNKHKFESEYFKNQRNDDKLELLLFSELCYLSSLNNKSDKRFWYLIEAIKENDL